MRCPKCGGEIPFYDLRPNCRHCGVHILYYTQDAGLARDAKRTELEGAAARMVIARVKANFIGGKAQIARVVCVLLTAAALLVPFGSVRYTIPMADMTYSVGVLGMVEAAQDGLLPVLPALLGSTLLSRHTLAVAVPTVMLFVLVLLDWMIFLALLLGFLNLAKSTRFLRNAALTGAILSALTQAAAFALCGVAADAAYASVRPGFGALAAFMVYLALFFLNRALLRAGIEPEYRENDTRRREMLRRVRAGEVDLDDLTLPVFESEEEREARMQALEEALKAEEGQEA